MHFILLNPGNFQVNIQVNFVNMFFPLVFSKGNKLCKGFKTLRIRIIHLFQIIIFYEHH